MARGVILIGFMGAGKTSVGKHLAARLGLPLVDTDTLIENEAGRSISNLFRDEGEDVFRALEARVLEAASERPPAVYATGGGIVTRPENWPLMRRLGTVVYLRGTADTLFERVRKATHRPLLQTEDPRGTFERLLESRALLYEQADFEVTTDRRTPREVADEVADKLRV